MRHTLTLSWNGGRQEDDRYNKELEFKQLREKHQYNLLITSIVLVAVIVPALCVVMIAFAENKDNIIQTILKVLAGFLAGLGPGVGVGFGINRWFKQNKTSEKQSHE